MRAYGPYKLYDCPDCGAGYCQPFKNPGPSYYEHNAEIYPTALAVGTDPMTFEYDEALRLLPRGGKLLDVGCGAGGFLHRARAAGFSVAGVDFNADRAAALRGAGFDVHHGDLPGYARTADSASFDVVTMFQVFEHLDDPAAWIDAAKSLLKPGGLLVLCTPNRDRTFDPFIGPGLEEIDNPPHHLTRWSEKSLSGFLGHRGLEIFECRALGYPLPLLKLMLRNSLRLGLTARLAPSKPKTVAGSTKANAFGFLVSAKESVLNAAAWAGYPLFHAVYSVLGWQGAVLFSVSRAKSYTS